MNNPSCVFEIKIHEQLIEGIEAKTEDLIDDPNHSSKLSEIQSSVVNWIKKRIYFDEVYRNWIIYVWSSILRIMGLNEITQGILHATGRRAGQLAYQEYIDQSEIKLPETFQNMMYLLKVFVQEVLVGLSDVDVELQFLTDKKSFLILQESPYTLGFPQGAFIPVCDVIAGELEATLERIVNKTNYNGASKVYVREVQCKTLGDPICKFEVTLVD
jgi:predicted hydrocarbon binding protein